MKSDDLVRYVNAHRMVMSWIREGGDLRHGATKEFTDWVNTFKMPDEDTELVIWMANNGKLEYEESARKFMA